MLYFFNKSTVRYHLGLENKDLQCFNLSTLIYCFKAKFMHFFYKSLDQLSFFAFFVAFFPKKTGQTRPLMLFVFFYLE